MRLLNTKARKIYLMLVPLVVWVVQVAHGADHRLCTDDKNLFHDPKFTGFGDQTGLWTYLQHTGKRSFDVFVSDGELEIRRIDKEPWMLFFLSVTDPSLGGETVRFSAELKGDAPAEPSIHGFPHVAGLYLKVGHHRNAVIAEHTPNNGSWDWQRVTVEKFVPEGISELRVGFVHQSGGVLWARNPTLTFASCPAMEN